MTKAELAKRIDDLGRRRDRLHALKTEANALTETITAELRKIKGKAAKGERYQAELLTAARLVIDDLAALQKATGPKMFLRCVKVDIKTARRELAAKLLAKLGRKTRSWQLRVYRRTPATAPRKAPR